MSNAADMRDFDEQADAAPERKHYILRHRNVIVFLSLVLCAAGAYAAYRMPASVFPQTDFPRVVILVDNGVMPADEMMATVTRPIEEAMKDSPGAVDIRSATSRGSAEINVFFDWHTDIIQSELYVLGRLSQIRSKLPPTAEYVVHRLTFSSFPVLGISLTSPVRDITQLWEKAEYEIKPRLLRIPDVASVNLVGGREPEYHIVVDTAKLDAHRLSLAQVSDAIAQTNTVVPAGMHEENRQLYLTLLDGRVCAPSDLGEIPVAWNNGAPILVKDIARVKRAAAPRFNIVTADGVEAVLLNVYSQPNGNTVGIADAVKEELLALRDSLPPDMRLAFFYDQSLFVRQGTQSVWESIGFGLLLSVAVLYLFLRSAATTLVAILAIPTCLLSTLVCMYAMGMSFNLMTLGGIAAAIGLIIDDAIVVAEAIHAKLCAGHAVQDAIRDVIKEVGPALVGSTVTPVAVFLPLAFLDGVPGVFFRALAFPMAASLLISLLLALTLTPTLGICLLRRKGRRFAEELEQGGPLLKFLIDLYERLVRRTIRHSRLAMFGMFVIVVVGVVLYGQLETDFLPHMDEGAFVLDYFSQPGTSLSETDRMLRHVETILRDTPEVESYSRRTGARLALAIAEPNTGDFLVKLKSNRSKSTDEVIDSIRADIEDAEPALHIEFAAVLGDLIGDLTWSPNPVEVKLFSQNIDSLRTLAPKIAAEIAKIPGVVDVNDGLVVAGPSAIYRVRAADAARAGLTTNALGAELETALFGKDTSYILEGDRVLPVRVLVDGQDRIREQNIALLPIRSNDGTRVTMNDVAAIEHEPGLLEIHREDQRQLIAVSGRFSGIDLRNGIAAIKRSIAENIKLPNDVAIEYGGLFEQQKQSFAHLTRALVMAVLLVFVVLMLEFRTVLHPLAIVLGALLALVGVVGALWITGTSLNIVSFLGAIIGFGIVAKNGIFMLDFVDQLQRRRGMPLHDALVQSGRRRLRPVLMTSLTAFLGLLPLAYGVGAGADMLRPLAIGVIGALGSSLVLSLIATPTLYYILVGMPKPLSPPKNATVNTVVSMCGCVAFCIAAGCGASPNAAEQPRAASVRTATAQVATLHPEIELIGTIVALPERTALLHTPLAGQIDKICVVEGQSVKAGDPVVELDTRRFEAELAKAKATLEEARAQAALLQKGPLPEEVEAARQEARKAKAGADAQRVKLKALEVLHEKREIADVQFNTARSALDEAEAANQAAAQRLKILLAGTRQELIAQANARVQAAESDFALRRLTMELSTIRSPIDGVVTQLPVRLGEAVDTSNLLAAVADLTEVFARVNIPSQYADQVRAGAEAFVRCNVAGTSEVAGTVARMAQEADLGSGDTTAYIRVSNAERAQRPGSACRVRIMLAAIPDAVTVPISALAEYNGAEVVTIIRDGKAYQTEVQTAARASNHVQITKGVTPGDLVAVEGGYGLPDGWPVALTNDDPSARQ